MTIIMAQSLIKIIAQYSKIHKILNSKIKAVSKITSVFQSTNKNSTLIQNCNI